MHTHLRRMQLFAITYYYHYRTPNDDERRRPPAHLPRQTTAGPQTLGCYSVSLLLAWHAPRRGARGRSVGGWYCKFVYSHSSTWAQSVVGLNPSQKQLQKQKQKQNSSSSPEQKLRNVQSQSVSQSSSLGEFASASSSVAFRIFNWVDVLRKIDLLKLALSVQSKEVV